VARGLEELNLPPIGDVPCPIGENGLRPGWMSRITRHRSVTGSEGLGLIPVTAIHPTPLTSPDTEPGNGRQVCARAAVFMSARVPIWPVV